MNFARSESGLDLNCQPGPLQQINQITHWLDSSNVYGSDAEEGERLRSHRSGLMKTSRASDGSVLLPIGIDVQLCLHLMTVHYTLFTYTNNCSPLLGGSNFGFPASNRFFPGQ